MIISFAWTTEALLAGRKTMTRRKWAPRTILAWQHAWDEGRRIHQAWDRVPFAGGKRLGMIELTCRPYQQRLRDMGLGDLVREGNLWNSPEEFIELFGGNPDQEVTVLEFRPVPCGDASKSGN